MLRRLNSGHHGADRDERGQIRMSPPQFCCIRADGERPPPRYILDNERFCARPRGLSR